MTAAHPDLEAEQAYVDRAYSLLDQGLASAEEQFQQHGALHRSTAQAMKRALDILRDSRGSGQLVFGRVDQDQQRLYIGRRRVHDHERNLVVVGWHAPAARVYYEATPHDSRGVLLKRTFVEENRRLTRIIDEVMAASAAAASTGNDEPPEISDALLSELDRSRDGAMREVVATIQAEQFRIIRAEPGRMLVVQGGPGTGKTVVALHRAAWLAFNHDKLRKHGLLVIAPNKAVLSYTSGVLPSLDAGDIHQADLASLYSGEASAEAGDDRETAGVKGSAEMAAVLRRALAARIGWPDENLVLSLGAAQVSVPAAEIQRILVDVRRRALAHNHARAVVRDSLSALAFQLYSEAQRQGRRPAIASEGSIRRLSAFTNALDRMWPSFTPEEMLRSLYGTQSWLVEAAEGVLTADERANLYRPAQASITEELWTPADLFCLDELSHLLDGDTVTYGHILVDEAQDLSPMQARALARRCPAGSFTLVGDLAQATGTWVRDSWDELTVHLGDSDVEVETLTIGYRVPAPVLDLASRQLPLISPGLGAPRSVRLGLGDPRVSWTTAEQLLPDAISAAAAALDEGLTTALIVPDERYEKTFKLCLEQGLDTGDGQDGVFGRPLTVVPASLSKGLEFDCVVLVAPDEIVSSSHTGRRLLYVAMTRCTQELHVVHAEALPAGLDHLDTGPELDTGAVAEQAEASSIPTQHTSSLEVLVEQLDPNDRQLVEQLVLRLLSPP